MFVVLGVSGNTGSVVARALLAEKHPVRVVVRDVEKGKPWKERGAEVAIADVEDAAGLERAFRGARGVYTLIPPDLGSKTPIERAHKIAEAIAAAAAAKNTHLVFLSSIGAQHESGTGPIRALHDAENVLRAAGVRSTFIRAPFFMENTLATRELTLSKQILPAFGDASHRFPMGATQDIGLVAAKALLEGAETTSIIELAGPRDFSIDDIAQAFSRALKKTITPVVLPLSEVVPTFTGMGVSAEIAALYREMYEGLASGRIDFERGSARFVRGTIDADAFAKSAFGA